MNNIEKLEQDIELTIKSINHWGDVYTENKVYGVYHCPLCSQYHSKVNKDIDNYICCNECPIYEKTNHVFCKETPYDNIVKISSDDTENIKKESINMITFLSELLKELNYKLKEEIKEEIKEEEEKKKENTFKIGDYLRLKNDVEISDNKFLFPNPDKMSKRSIFKVANCLPRGNIKVSYIMDSQLFFYTFKEKDFEKIIPQIRISSIVVFKETRMEIKIISKVEIKEKLGNYFIGEYLDNKRLVIVDENDVRIIME